MVTFVMLKYRVAEKSVFQIFHIFRTSFIFRSFSALKNLLLIMMVINLIPLRLQ